MIFFGNAGIALYAGLGRRPVLLTLSASILAIIVTFLNDKLPPAGPAMSNGLITIVAP